MLCHRASLPSLCRFGVIFGVLSERALLSLTRVRRVAPWAVVVRGVDGKILQLFYDSHVLERVLVLEISGLS